MTKRDNLISVATAIVAGALLLCCSSSDGLDGADVYVNGNNAAELSTLPLAAVDTVDLCCPDSIVLGAISKVYQQSVIQ